MATQLVIYGKRLIVLTFLWVSCLLLLSVVHLPITGIKHFITFAPVYGLFLLGLHAILSVLFGVANFNDCSDARKELLEEIKEARADLTKRKVL